MKPINFFIEDVSFELKHKKVLRQWLIQIAKNYDQEIDTINYIYCSDNYLLDINKTYLDHDYYTDIITFDERDYTDDPISADIFISIDRVRDNASTMSHSFQDELHRVMVHGLLHLLGEDDKEEASKQKMRESETASLSLLQL